jgi:hypothetical protein
MTNIPLALNLYYTFIYGYTVKKQKVGLNFFAAGEVDRPLLFC